MQYSIIERCIMSPDDRAHITADLLIGNMFDRDYEDCAEERLIMMKLLCYIDKIDTSTANFFSFINDIRVSKLGREIGVT